MTTLSDLEKKFVDELAALEHEQWMTWAQSIMDTEPLTVTRKHRWEKLMIPFSDLSEEMKEHDRKWARKVLDLVKRRFDN